VVQLKDEAPALPKVLARPLPLPNKDVVADITDCHLHITLNLQFHGDGARQDLITTWVAATKSVWSGQMSKDCCDIVLTINTKLGGPVDPMYAQINVSHVPPGGKHRANNTLGHSGVKDDIQGEWADTDTDGMVAAHELGHAMGQDDEYADDASGASQPTGDAATEADQQGVEPSIMSQTWKNRFGDKPSAKVRHVDNIIKAYGLTCPKDCMEKWTPLPTQPAGAVPPTATRPAPTATPTATPRPVTTTMSFAHTRPGVSSEVYLEVQGPAGAQVRITLTGPGVASAAQQTATIPDGGSLKLTWTINRFGAYTVTGAVGATQVTKSVNVN
jgi:hypothetical protein